MPDTRPRRWEWSPDAAYADALAELHSVVERNFPPAAAPGVEPVGDDPFEDDPFDGERGRHGAPNPGKQRTAAPGTAAPRTSAPSPPSSRRNSIGAAKERRRDHAQELVREPLVNGTRASDLFLLLQQHGDLDVPGAAPDGARAGAADALLEADPPVVVAEPAPPPRIPGRRTGFIPIPEPDPPERRSVRERIAAWLPGIGRGAAKAEARMMPVTNERTGERSDSRTKEKK